jgi:hypothetical protein
MWPGIIMKNDENLVWQPGLPLPSKSISTVLSSYSVSRGKETHKDQYLGSQKTAGMFFFTDYVALNYIAGENDWCHYIMDALLILLVARLNLASSCVKMH